MKILPFPEVVFATSSGLSGDIKVVGHGPDRKLVVGGLVQSVSKTCPDLENKVWGKLLQFPWSVPANPSALVLGLGGGTTVHLLSQKFIPRSIAVVEIDGAIIDVAQRFFDLGEVPNLKIEKADGVDFVSREMPPSFDLAVVDVYLGGHFPREASQAEFYQNLKRKLKPGACVCVNRIFYDDEHLLRQEFRQVLSAVFGEATQVALPGKTSMKNYLYFARL